MSTDPSDASPSTSQPPPKPRPSSSPPLADTVVRPFTSQGGTFSGSLEPLSYPYSPSRSSDRRSSVHDPPVQLSSSKFGPYTSASARTSYTRVDVDSLPPPVYPPLPPLPAAFMVQNVPVAIDPTALSPTPPRTPTPDAPVIEPPPIPQTPQVSLTFLLVSGQRKTQSFEPETTVGRVKELVWNAWPTRDADWEDERPPAPSYFRILYLGKILQDDDTLLRVGFPTVLPSTPHVSPTIVHLSIRPYALPSDDPSLSKKKRLSVAISRRLSSAGVTIGIGGGGRSAEHVAQSDERRTGCCSGCTIC